ncbi:purine nucleoside transporter [Opitutaceae bacterium TAV5]|nr:purine nucleoside transporter [Opitutaceae bacterium TAV5]
MRLIALFPGITLSLCIAATAAPASAAEPPLKVAVVIVTMFEIGADTGDMPGEFQLWVEREKLDRVIPLPQAYHDVRANADGSVIGIVTGMGNTRSAASIMALGLDPRFDLSQAYWLVAGIAGIDPADGTLGSAVWAEWLVDADLGHEIDAREIPAGWKTGYLPFGRTEPYQQPRKDLNLGEAYRLDPGLVEWAYQLTKDTPLPDNEKIAARRAAYTGYPNAQRPPFVLKGDQLAGSTYWHGKLMNEWANDWVRYHTDGKGNYVTTAMEETGTLQSLTWLDRAGKVDVKRVLVLRTASNFDMQWPGGTAAESLASEKGDGYSGLIPALEAAWRVGSRVVHELLKNRDRYATELPGP